MIWQQQNNSDALKQYYKDERSVLEVQIYDSLRVTPGHDQPRVWMWVMAFEKKNPSEWEDQGNTWGGCQSSHPRRLCYLKWRQDLWGKKVSTSLLTTWITTLVWGPQWLHGSSEKSRLYRSVTLRRMRQLYKTRRVVLHDGKGNKG